MSIHERDRERVVERIILKQKELKEIQMRCYARPVEDQVECLEQIKKLKAEIQGLKDSLKPS